MFAEQGVDHVVLNAHHDEEEAAIVAQAGEPGRITVATNMAGRGTDIKLAPASPQPAGCTSCSPKYTSRAASTAN